MYILWSLLFSSVSYSNSVQNYLDYVRHLDTDTFYDEHIEGYESLYTSHQVISDTVKKYPGRVRPIHIGDTVDNHPIWAFRISNPIQKPSHRILVIAGLHAMEWMGLDVSLNSLVTLAEHPPPNVEIVIVPWINIDKRLLAEQDRIQSRQHYRRSNMNGVDLNRDFEINREATAIWRHFIPHRYTTSPAPLSQPESQAVENLLASMSFNAAISLHSFGGYLYYPWAALYRRVPDRETFVRLGQVMQNAQEGAYPYRVEQLTHWFFIFRIQGSEIDHMYGKYGIHAFLIELTYTGVRPFDRSTWTDNFYLYNPKSLELDKQRGINAVLALSRHYSTIDW